MTTAASTWMRSFHLNKVHIYNYKRNLQKGFFFRKKKDFFEDNMQKGKFFRHLLTERDLMIFISLCFYMRDENVLHIDYIYYRVYFHIYNQLINQLKKRFTSYTDICWQY